MTSKKEMLIRSALIDGTASLLSASYEDIRRSNKTTPGDWLNATVEYDEASGGGFVGTLEVFHQLHCLVSLRALISRQ